MTYRMLAALALLGLATSAQAQVEQDVCASARDIAGHYPGDLKAITGAKDGEDNEGKITMPLARYCYVTKKRGQYACFFRSQGEQAEQQSLALLDTLSGCFPQAATGTDMYRSVRLGNAQVRLSRSKMPTSWTVLIAFLQL